MTGLPPLLEGDRVLGAVLIPLAGIGQAVALGVGAFATRDAFGALHAGGVPSSVTLTTLALAGLAAAVLELLARRQSEALGQSYATALRVRLYEHLAGMDRRALSQKRIGALSLRFVGDLTAARSWFGRGLTRLASAVVVLPGAAAVLYLLDPTLAAAAAGPVALSLAIMLAAALGLETRHRALRSRRANISIAMMERVAISPELDLAGRTPRELDELEDGGAELRRNAVSRATRTGLLRVLPHAGAVLAGAAMLFASGRYGLAPAETAAGLSVLAILMIPLREMADVWDQFCAWRVAREKALVLLAQPSRRRQIVARGCPVEVKLVGLALGKRLLDAVIPAGDLAIVTGPQGSGKSQLLTMIAGLDRAPMGHILYDGRPAPLPRIAHVTDRTLAVQGSLRRNLTLGIDPRPKRREVERVARTFGLDRLIDRLDGLMGRLGEAGRNVSGGEAFRVDLARTALSKPDLVTIDSARLLADPDRSALIEILRRETAATILIASPPTEAFAADLVLDLASHQERSGTKLDADPT